MICVSLKRAKTMFAITANDAPGTQSEIYGISGHGVIQGGALGSARAEGHDDGS